MSYSVKLFKNTGFNAVNGPSKISLLEGMQYDTYPAAEVIEPYKLTSLVISATYDNVFGADYMEVYDSTHRAFYSVDGYDMTSPDVAVMHITMDYTLTYLAYKGYDSVGSIKFLDGITERHHVAAGNDVFGNFCEEDNLLIPAAPMEVDDSGNLLDLPYSGGETIVESRIDLTDPGTAAITYTDPSTNETVTVPKMRFTGTRGNVVIADPSGGPSASIVNPSAEYYDGSDNTIKGNIEKAQNLNLESGILNSWVLPSGAATVSKTSSGICYMNAQVREQSSGLNFVFQNVNNKRALYGGTTKYIIYSPASGSSVEYQAEDICKNGNTVLTAPVVASVCDPRPDGRPYYNTKYHHGGTPFWPNCIPGEQWMNAPINFNSKSGISLETANFVASRDIAKQDLANYTELGNARKVYNETALGQSKANMIMGIGANAAGIMSNPSLGSVVGGLVNTEQGMYNYGMQTMEAGISIMTDLQAIQMKKMAMNQELQAFQIATQYTVPSISFPRSNTIRDILGNGVRMLRIRPASVDVTKFDKILTMFGYRVTEPLAPAHFTNRAKFNFVKAAGVSISDQSAPKWLKDGVAAELSVGHRYWHVKPYDAAYTDGTNV